MFDLIGILSIIIVLLYIYHRCTLKYKDIYTLTTYFGRKGCGKSTTMQKIALKHIKDKWNVYVDNESSFIKGVNYINCEEIWKEDIKPHSVILIDESVIKWNKRAWKDFPPEAQEFFISQRKYKVKIIMFSNTFGVDSAIRDMTDYLYVCRKFARIFTLCVKWYKEPVILSSQETGREARATDDFKRVPFLFGGISITFLPRYVKYFDTNKVFSNKKSSKKIW